MMKTQISITETADGRTPTIPGEYQANVAKAAKHLEDELADIDQFDILAKWRIREIQGNRFGAVLDLTVNQPDGIPTGITGYPFEGDVFNDDDHIRRALNRPIQNFASLLSYLNKFKLRKIQQNLSDMEPLLIGSDFS